MIRTLWACDSLGIVWQAYSLDGVIVGWIGNGAYGTRVPVGELVPCGAAPEVKAQ